MNHLTVYLGYDSREPLAFAVAAHSLATRASRPVPIVPLVQASLRSSGLYKRERRSNESTEFSLTRFLCAHLSEYSGWSLFLDSDVLVLADVFELLLFPLLEPGRAVYVCKHDYTPKAITKFDGHEQTKYQKKNWSSVMLVNNGLCKSLTPEYVNTASGLQLHQMHWLKDEQIGSLPLYWNHLVGEYEPNPNAKILHYTLGGPWHGDEFADGEEARLWRDELASMTRPMVAV